MPDTNVQFNTPTGLYVSGGGITFDVTLTATNVVTGFNGATGAVTGVTGVAAGTGVSISGTTRPTITNTGVTDFNSLTGSVSGVGTVNGLTGDVTFSVINLAHFNLGFI